MDSFLLITVSVSRRDLRFDLVEEIIAIMALPTHSSSSLSSSSSSSSSEKNFCCKKWVLRLDGSEGGRNELQWLLSENDYNMSTVMIEKPPWRIA